jgi:phospholipid/cholesterol/gamma-HCH transport system ATP-binding protein
MNANMKEHTSPFDKKEDVPEKRIEKVVEIKNLKKNFGTQEVLKEVSLDLFKNENLVILGKSGTGKSVLIKCLVGLLSYDAGEITLLNTKLTGIASAALNDLRKKIGFLFQGAALYDSMSVRQNLMFPLNRIHRKMKQGEINEKIELVLDNVGLLDAIDKMPSQLSGGMRKRIGLARTLIVDPLLMLYDEPTTGLDPITSDEISELINKVQKKYKTSSIIITHDLACVKATADRIIILRDGRVYANGTLSDFAQLNDEWINNFLKLKNNTNNEYARREI